MTRIRTAALWIAVAGSIVLPVSETPAQTVSSRMQKSGMQVAQASLPTDQPAPRRRVRRVPIYPRYQGEPVDGVYPRYNPGPNAVRDCTATYVEEFRPSGTVITPRMNCVWRPG